MGPVPVPCLLTGSAAVRYCTSIFVKLRILIFVKKLNSFVDFVAIGSGYSYCRGKLIQPIEPETQLKRSVADPGCLSRILIFVHPGFRIPDLKTEGWKNLFSHLFLLPQISQNWKLFIFELGKEKIWASLLRIIELFTQKIVIQHSKI